MGKKTTVEQDEKRQSAMAEHSSLWNRFLLFLTSPTDPSNLAVLRIIFGKTVVFLFKISIINPLPPKNISFAPHLPDLSFLLQLNTDRYILKY